MLCAVRATNECNIYNTYVSSGGQCELRARQQRPAVPGQPAAGGGQQALDQPHHPQCRHVSQ